MSKTLQDKYNQVNVQLDNTIRAANAEMSTLRDRISTLQSEQQAMARKNQEMNESLHSKTRQFNKLKVF